ncbi:MAG: cytochrome C oxidase Cbb3, partial [Novosphingobium sp.]|nr:cytochrome C oxidase Cbb3 [Novosphingobium sp.]
MKGMIGPMLAMGAMACAAPLLAGQKLGETQPLRAPEVIY